MSKVDQVKVTSCWACRHYERDHCLHPKVYFEKINNNNVIPDWCPLEEKP